MRGSVPIAVSLILLGGCLSTNGSLQDPVDDVENILRSLVTFKDGRVREEIPLRVFLIGFPAESVKALQASLTTETADHGVGDLNQVLPLDPDQGVDGNAPLVGSQWRLPMLPTANFTIQAATPEFEAEVVQFLATIHVGDDPVLLYDANAFEDFLAQRLPDHGQPLDPNTPSLALVHLDALGIDVHGWTYTFPHGYMEPLAAFGERQPLLVWDPSATKNPQPGLVWQIVDPLTGTQREPYSDRLEATGDDLATITQQVREAVHFRFLHGAIYPIPLTDCHAITLLYAIRPTNASPLLGLPDGEELFHPDELQRAFANVTGGTVYVDAQMLVLPVDDPALDAIARGEFATMEVLRFWLSTNWESYWVPHEGCEPYVSFVMHGDVASVPTGFLGIGTYDQDKSYRISMSWVHEAVRWIRDDASPLPIHPLGDPSGPYNWVQFLFAHEVGHTIGMHHPFHSGWDEGPDSNERFQDVWTTMSYSTDGRVVDFSMVDRADYQRNRVGYLFAAADERGLADSEAWTAALDAAGTYNWTAAAGLLWPAVEAAAPADGGADGQPWIPDELVLLPRHQHTHDDAGLPN